MCDRFCHWRVVGHEGESEVGVWGFRRRVELRTEKRREEKGNEDCEKN